MKSRNTRRFTFVIAIYIALTGCTQDFIEPYRVDPNNLSGEAFWEDPELARGVVSSCYTVLMSRSLWGRMYLQPLVLMAHESDDLWLKWSFWNEFNTNNLTADNERVRLHYTEFYSIIRDANDYIDNYPSIKTSERFKQNDIDDWLGQAYFMRAYAYFNLVCLYGEDYPAYNSEALAVPLVLSVPKTEDELYPKRATVKDIYAQIESDYKKAIELIPDDMRDESEYGRVGRMAVHGYLGKAYLWQQKYTEAIGEFEKIMSSNLFTLVDTMQHVYDGEHEFGPESIWELNYSEKSIGVATTYEGGTLHQVTLIFSPRLGWSNLYVPNHAIARFGSDPRVHESIAMAGHMVAGKRMGSRDRPFTRKFITTSHISGIWDIGWHSNIVLLRLSDIYLLYAECQNALGNDGEALKYVNMVRKRAYFIDRNTPDDQVDDAIAYKNLTGIALRDTIREERWRELFHEGHRWFDIQRWKILEEEIAKVPGQITNAGPVVYQSQAYYFPIPLVDIKANPNLIPSTKY